MQNTTEENICIQPNSMLRLPISLLEKDNHSEREIEKKTKFRMQNRSSPARFYLVMSPWKTGKNCTRTMHIKVFDPTTNQGRSISPEQRKFVDALRELFARGGSARPTAPWPSTGEDGRKQKAFTFELFNWRSILRKGHGYCWHWKNPCNKNESEMYPPHAVLINLIHVSEFILSTA